MADMDIEKMSKVHHEMSLAKDVCEDTVVEGIDAVDIGDCGPVDSDWRAMVMESYRDGNVEGMIRDAAPLAQSRIIGIAANGPLRESLDASKFLLAQAGHGPVQKSEARISMYDGTPDDQLRVIFTSKLSAIGKRDPAALEALRDKIVELGAGDYEEIKEVE
jgi:hypothetical protein